MYMETFPPINCKWLSISHQNLHLTSHISLWSRDTTINKGSMPYLKKKKTPKKKQKLFIVYILGYFQTIINTWLVSLSMAAAHYTSNKPHHKSGWYVWAYTALQINDNSKRHHVASTREGIFPWHTEGEPGSVFFVPSRLLNEMLPLCTLWVQLFNRLQLARLVTGWTTITK